MSNTDKSIVAIVVALFCFGVVICLQANNLRVLKSLHPELTIAKEATK